MCVRTVQYLFICKKKNIPNLLSRTSIGDYIKDDYTNDDNDNVYNDERLGFIKLMVWGI